jgi:hypothetical protein
MSRLLRIAIAGIAFPAFSSCVVFAQSDSYPRPNAGMQKTLNEKGVRYEEWLLFEGIRSARLEYVRAALEKGADPNTARDWLLEGMPPLFAAASRHRPNLNILRLLIERGANVNARWTPVTNLSRPDITPAQRSVFREMLTAQNRDYFPLYYAARYSNSPELVELLLQLGADLNAKTANGGNTALFGTRDPQIAQVLLRHGADINAKNNFGETALMDAKASLSLNPQASQPTRTKFEAYCAWLIAHGAKE